MKRCPDCNKLLFSNTEACSRCGWKLKEDRISFWLCVLSLLCSAFGIIYWILAYRQTPRRATACGLTALLAPIILTIFLVLSLVGLLLLV